MPRIVCLSDTHSKHSQLVVPDGDILVFAGDYSSWGDAITEVTYFNTWLGKLPHKHKIVINGNHDGISQNNPDTIKQLLSHATYLQDSGVEIEGIKFWGSAWTPTFLNWFWMKDRGNEIRKCWDLIPNDTDVLITHGPPFGHLDTIGPGQKHLGCEELLVAVKRVKPKCHIFGHIHGSGGKIERNCTNFDTQFINASVLDEDYKLANEPIIIDWKVNEDAEVV